MMKHFTRVLVLLAMLLQFASPSYASLDFHVDVNTGVLIGNTNGPFWLDFQLNGGGPIANTATISNFSFGPGGSGTAGTENYFGNSTGSLGASVLLTSGTIPFNEFFQGFTPGCMLGFDVSLTTGVNLTPDAFAFAILDANTFNITTNGLGDSLLLVNLDGSFPALLAFAGAGNYAGVTVTAIPEPDILLLVLTSLAGLCLIRRRQRGG